MSGTSTAGGPLDWDEIAELKTAEAEKYERMERMGAAPEPPDAVAPPMNREQRRAEEARRRKAR